MIKDTPVSIQNLDDLINACKNNLEMAKAHDIVGIDLKNQSSIADYMIIASGTSDRHVSAIAYRIEDFLNRSGVHGITLSGDKLGEWVIVDLGSLLVHIMQPQIRERYRLEDLYRLMAQGEMLSPEDLMNKQLEE